MAKLVASGVVGLTAAAFCFLDLFVFDPKDTSCWHALFLALLVLDCIATLLVLRCEFRRSRAQNFVVRTWWIVQLAATVATLLQQRSLTSRGYLFLGMQLGLVASALLQSLGAFFPEDVPFWTAHDKFRYTPSTQSIDTRGMHSLDDVLATETLSSWSRDLTVDVSSGGQEAQVHSQRQSLLRNDSGRWHRQSPSGGASATSLNFFLQFHEGASVEDPEKEHRKGPEQLEADEQGGPTAETKNNNTVVKLVADMIGSDDFAPTYHAVKDQIIAVFGRQEFLAHKDEVQQMLLRQRARRHSKSGQISLHNLAQSMRPWSYACTEKPPRAVLDCLDHVPNGESISCFTGRAGVDWILGHGYAPSRGVGAQLGHQLVLGGMVEGVGHAYAFSDNADLWYRFVPSSPASGSPSRSPSRRKLPFMANPGATLPSPASNQRRGVRSLCVSRWYEIEDRRIQRASFICYTIEVEMYDGGYWVAVKRFAEFWLFYKQLCREFGTTMKIPVPPEKTMLGVSSRHTKFIERRLQRLDVWLGSVLTLLRLQQGSTAVRLSERLATFLRPPSPVQSESGETPICSATDAVEAYREAAAS